MNFKDTQFHI